MDIARDSSDGRENDGAVKDLVCGEKTVDFEKEIAAAVAKLRSADDLTLEQAQQKLRECRRKPS